MLQCIMAVSRCYNLCVKQQSLTYIALLNRKNLIPGYWNPLADSIWPKCDNNTPEDERVDKSNNVTVCYDMLQYCSVGGVRRTVNAIS